jgi:nondiscriminating glutamyl-tRNA synthetase
VIEKWVSILKDKSDDFVSSEDFDAIQNQVKEECGVKGKHLFMPIRVAVIGVPSGAELKDLVPLIQRENLIKRAEIVLEKC